MYSNNRENDFSGMRFIVFENPQEQQDFIDRLSKIPMPDATTKQFLTALRVSQEFFWSGGALWQYSNGRWDCIMDEMPKTSVKNINFEG